MNKKFPEYLAKGSYGEVYKISENLVEKRTNIFEDDYINIRNLNEVLFLNTYAKNNLSFIPKLYSVNITKKYFKSIQSFQGITLQKLSNILSYSERIKMIPILMCQIAVILSWLKLHNLVHMDLKPSNLCIQNNILSMIDFGLIGMINKNSAKYYGTKSFADPRYLSLNKRVTYSYDMMSMGLTLLSFLNKSFILETSWSTKISKKRYETVLSDQSFYTILKDIRTTIGKKYSNILLSMIEYNEQKRIKPGKLYDELKCMNKKYPLIDDNTYIEIIPNIDDLDDSEFKKIIKFLGNILWIERSPYLIGYVSKLFYLIFANKISLKAFNLEEYGVMCVLIGLSLFDKYLTTNEIRNYLNEKSYTDKYHYLNIVKKIINITKGDIYPTKKYVDFDMPVSFDKNLKKDYKKWVDLCSDINFLCKPEFQKINQYNELFGEYKTILSTIKIRSPPLPIEDQDLPDIFNDLF